MNKFIEMFIILMGVLVTIGATILIGEFHGGLRIFELALAGMSMIRIIILLFRDK